MLCQLLLHSKMNQPYMYIYPLPFGFPSHLRHHSALSRVPCAIQYVPLSCLFYAQYQQCICVNPNLPIPPTPPLSPLVSIHLSLRLCLYFCIANKVICTIFLDSTYTCYYTIFVFLFLTYFTLYDTLQVHPLLYKWTNFIPFYG